MLKDEEIPRLPTVVTSETVLVFVSQIMGLAYPPPNITMVGLLVTSGELIRTQATVSRSDESFGPWSQVWRFLGALFLIRAKRLKLRLSYALVPIINVDNVSVWFWNSRSIQVDGSSDDRRFIVIDVDHATTDGAIGNIRALPPISAFSKNIRFAPMFPLLFRQSRTCTYQILNWCRFPERKKLKILITPKYPEVVAAVQDTVGSHVMVAVHFLQWIPLLVGRV